MFDRATITLDIGPHSTYRLLYFTWRFPTKRVSRKNHCIFCQWIS